jgi:hypothetical protein
MLHHLAASCQTNANPFPFWQETLSIFLGDVLATIFIAVGASVLWYILKYPGFHVGANWTYIGWDVKTMGRLPNESDAENLILMPNISVTSRDTNIKKVISAVWVRERADVTDPGEILGHLDLQRAGIPPEVRTTGGDLLNLRGPTIECRASAFRRVTFFPVFIQTSDGEFYKANSPGNNPKGIARLRYKCQKLMDEAKQRLLRKLS